MEREAIRHLTAFPRPTLNVSKGACMGRGRKGSLHGSLHGLFESIYVQLQSVMHACAPNMLEPHLARKVYASASQVGTPDSLSHHLQSKCHILLFCTDNCYDVASPATYPPITRHGYVALGAGTTELRTKPT